MSETLLAFAWIVAGLSPLVGVAARRLCDKGHDWAILLLGAPFLLAMALGIGSALAKGH